MSKLIHKSIRQSQKNRTNRIMLVLFYFFTLFSDDFFCASILAFVCQIVKVFLWFHYWCSSAYFFPLFTRTMSMCIYNSLCIFCFLLLFTWKMLLFVVLGSYSITSRNEKKNMYFMLKSKSCCFEMNFLYLFWFGKKCQKKL